MTYMFASGFWLPRDEALQLSKLLMVFLQGYTACSRLSFEAGLHRFALVPKLHFLHHAAHRLKLEASQAPWATSPLAESNQVQEDYVGKPSRLSRRVDTRKAHLRIIQRSLISVRASLESSDLDERGLGPWYQKKTVSLIAVHFVITWKLIIEIVRVQYLETSSLGPCLQHTCKGIDREAWRGKHHSHGRYGRGFENDHSQRSIFGFAALYLSIRGMSNLGNWSCWLAPIMIELVKHWGVSVGCLFFWGWQVVFLSETILMAIMVKHHQASSSTIEHHQALQDVLYNIISLECVLLQTIKISKGRTFMKGTYFPERTVLSQKYRLDTFLQDKWDQGIHTSWWF